MLIMIEIQIEEPICGMRFAPFRNNVASKKNGSIKLARTNKIYATPRIGGK